MSNYTIKKTITVSDDDIENIMSAALQGITYWCGEADIRGLIKKEDEGIYTSQALTRGYRIGLWDAEGAKYHQLTLKKLLNGIALYGRDDFGDWDMYDADSAIQFALFGKQVYA